MSMKYSGALGSSVVKIFDAVAASTGLTETTARAAGFNAAAAVIVKEHRASYYPDGREIVLKLVYERPSGRLLGGQAFGEKGVEKRIDALCTALHGKMTLNDLAEIDFSYSPPFSSANDLLNLAAFAGQNDLSGYAPLIGAEKAQKLLAGPTGTEQTRPVILDVRNLNEYGTSHVRGALHIPVDELRLRLDEVPREALILIYCRSGFRSHLALRILKGNGCKNVHNITGGYVAMRALGGFEIEE
jgi:rhodanese-related sulfurtransferase